MRPAPASWRMRAGVTPSSRAAALAVTSFMGMLCRPCARWLRGRRALSCDKQRFFQGCLHRRPFAHSRKGLRAIHPSDARLFCERPNFHLCPSASFCVAKLRAERAHGLIPLLGLSWLQAGKPSAGDLHGLRRAHQGAIRPENGAIGVRAKLRADALVVCHGNGTLSGTAGARPGVSPASPSRMLGA